MAKGLPLSLAALMPACSSSSPSGPNPGATPSPLPVPTPAPTPTPTPIPDNLLPETHCVPKPPPTAALRVKVHLDFGYKKVLDSRALVGPDADYCAQIGEPGTVCVVRDENDPRAVTCNKLAMGKAQDTGRYGPTWFYNDQPCRGIGEGGSDLGCRNHETNQFLVYAFGPGSYGACAANGVCHAFRVD